MYVSLQYAIILLHFAIAVKFKLDKIVTKATIRRATIAVSVKIRRSEIICVVQAAAIILPVAALSAIALHFLRQDKAAIEREARDRAQAEMPDLTRNFQRYVQDLVQHGSGGSIRDGQVLAASDYPRQPE